MKLVRLKDVGEDVKYLQNLLIKVGYNEIIADGNFGPVTQASVLDFQKHRGLTSDGLVGFKTWDDLIFRNQINKSDRITEETYSQAAYLLSCDSAAIKAVKDVESGIQGGFFNDGRPVILFEGHIFWKELINVGMNPNLIANKSNQDILYKTWTKRYYKGGVGEYDRLDRARRINSTAANKSTSWGLFQIMGNNYKLSGCSDINEFINLNSLNEVQHLRLFVRFIYNCKLGSYLRDHKWDTFASKYNGPGYKSNSYDTKLAKAYAKYK